MPTDPPPPSLTVGAVARRLGVAPATLRTWDRRYGLGPTGHEEGRHRRYDAGDLARLERMHTLVLEGVSAAEAARLARTDTAATPDGPAMAPAPAPAPAPADASRAQRGLGRAAAALDAPAVTRLIAAAVAEHGVAAAWSGLLVPVLVAAGRRWETTGTGVDVEHLLTECVIGVLHNASRDAPTPSRRARPVLLACAEGEYHSLPLHAVRAALAIRGDPARMLGVATPRDALADAVRRINPASVLLWSSMAETGRVELFGAIPAQRPPVVPLAAGPGWDTAVLPPGVRHVTSLPEALAALAAASGRPGHDA